MDNQTEERLLNLFQEASGGSRGGNLAPSLSGGVEAHADSASDFSGASESTPFNPSQDSGAGQSYSGISGTSRSTDTGSGGNGLESFASTLFGGALGLVPLVGSLFGLFGGGSKQPPVFQKYEMPSPISFEAADVGGTLVNSSYGQMGLPRVYDSGTDSGSQASPSTAAPASGGSSSGGASSSVSHQISVNVQAMDAQSFMSYSGDIAKAVREAMLNLSSLNDVVTDL